MDTFTGTDHLISVNTVSPSKAYQTPLIVQPPPILELQIEMEVRRADFALTPPREIVPPVSPALSLETVSPELHILMDTSTEVTSPSKACQTARMPPPPL
eukprot:sb/3478788/